MPLDGITLSFAVREAQCLIGGRIDRATQPEKDMAVLTVRSDSRNLRLVLSASPAMARFHITDESFTNPPQAPMFCMLMRKYLIGGRIESVTQPHSERVVRIVVNNHDELGESGPCELWLEIMGRHSNLTLVKSGRIIDAIRHVGADMSRVRHILPGLTFVPPPVQDKLAPDELTPEALTQRLGSQSGRLSSALLAVVAGLSPVSSREWALRVSGLQDAAIDQLDIAGVAERVCDFARRMPEMGAPVLLTDENGAKADFFPFPYLSYPTERQNPCASLQQAMSAFFSLRDRSDRMQQKSASLKRTLKNMLEREEKKLSLLEDALREAADADRYRLYGELLSAQMHLISKGIRQVSLTNFYSEDNQPIVIPLDETLSPAQNAQRYFKKYKKAMASRKSSSEQKELCLKEIRLLEEALFDLEECETVDDLNDVRHALEAQGLLKPDKNIRRKKPVISAPHRFLSSEGFTILAGKNSVQNERLTKEARGDDLWLHAKDMPGSHVILCLEGKALTQTALLEAARVAAWFSKSRGVTVPVDYTYRKYVKKPGGTPAGFVTFTHNKTLLVSTTEAEVRNIVGQSK